MREIIKYLWIDALTSGRYKRGKGYLRQRVEYTSELCYCPLGILADLYTQITGKGRWEVDQYLRSKGEFRWVRKNKNHEVIGMAVSELPHEVMEWAGMRDTGGTFPYVVAGQFSIIDLNDQTQLTFKDIAEVIYEQL